MPINNTRNVLNYYANAIYSSPRLFFRFYRIKESSLTCCFLLYCLPISLIRKAFKRLHYPVDIIAQCVRWYLAYALSLRNLEEMMAERGVIVDHSTLHRWVIRLVQLLDKTFRRHKCTVVRRWSMDETYIKIKGQWKYLYRAVDTAGQTIDFLLTAKRDAAAALVTLNADKAEDETITIRQSKYLNNLIEQYHRNIKRRIADDEIQILSAGADYTDRH